MMRTLGTLPSEAAVIKLVSGKPGGVVEVASATLGRAVLISIPFFVIGVPPKDVVLGAMSASSLITAFVIVKTYAERKRRRA